jgi:GTP-binding protein HflX
MSKLKRELKDMSKVRDTQRSSRRRSGIPQVAIAGYTNAGKSSLLNRLTGAGVLVEDALFATLDPTVRKTRTPGGRDITMADTVGFVRHLPHQLVEAFKSTLEEVTSAALVLHVVDGSEDAPELQLRAVREVLAEIGAGNIPELVVINKADAADELQLSRLLRIERGAVVVSAHSGQGIDELFRRIEELLPGPNQAVRALVPYERGELVAKVMQHGLVDSVEYQELGTLLIAKVDAELAAELAAFEQK